MLSAGADCVFMGLFLYISGVGANSICALKGSSVDLHCSALRPTSSMKWFTVRGEGNKKVLDQIFADEKRVNISEESNFTMTINDLRESDKNFYCCSDVNDRCQGKEIQLLVADLQVKVFPATGEKTVSLMCSSSCPLTERPVVYIWYKNTEFLYEDLSPWYQELISSEESVTYSCAVKGYKHLRAPEVSVDSLTSACFTVTYAKGRMCSNQQRPEDEPCSITYPREIQVHVQKTEFKAHVKLACNTSCPQTEAQTITWYKNRQLEEALQPVLITSRASYSCAVEHLISDEVCIQDLNCFTVNYVNRRICALQGSSVNISSEYSHPHFQQPKYKSWYKNRRSDLAAGEELITNTDRIKFHELMNRHILTINKLNKNDSAEYIFRIGSDAGKWAAVPGVTLVITGLRVKFSPSEEVTEGQRVTLTCRTSCPLTDNMNYIWYLNNQPLTKTQSKYLVLDPVSSEHEGNYSCKVKMLQKSSHQKMLTVHSKINQTQTAIGYVALLLVVIPTSIFFWIRRKKTSIQSPTETSVNLEEISPDHEYDDISAQPVEEDDILYSSVQLPNYRDALYSQIQPHQPQEEEQSPYDVVSFTPKTTPE
ncbi:uncharacterized protein LOC133953676 [Platichthys flesus]|uniref:uncharacterized protein LOC133953676 n=1 Tax=Platichthys flesus TaxID=8260 RepID=UPI002DBEFE30|nr:uncharacterized protein LOC133953676 [Platichthys flesus]